MKRFTIFAICVLILFAFSGCRTDHSNAFLNSGIYYMVGDFEKGLTPYVSLSFEDHGFRMGAGSLVSLQVHGSFEVNETTLVATSPIATFVFEIKDSDTLILIDNGDNEYFQPQENAEFVFSEDMK